MLCSSKQGASKYRGCTVNLLATVGLCCRRGELRESITNGNRGVLAVGGPCSPSCSVRVSARRALSCTHVRMHACASPRLARCLQRECPWDKSLVTAPKHRPRQRRADPDSPTRPLTLPSGPVSHARRSLFLTSILYIYVNARRPLAWTVSSPRPPSARQAPKLNKGSPLPHIKGTRPHLVVLLFFIPTWPCDRIGLPRRSSAVLPHHTTQPSRKSSSSTSIAVTASAVRPGSRAWNSSDIFPVTKDQNTTSRSAPLCDFLCNAVSARPHLRILTILI